MALPDREMPLIGNANETSRGLKLSILVVVIFVISIVVVSYLDNHSSETADLTAADVLVAPSGYMLRPAPESESALKARIEADPNARKVFREVAFRDVVVADSGVLAGTLTVEAADPSLVTEPHSENVFVRAVERELAAEARRVTLEGQSIFEVVVPEPTETSEIDYVLTWQYENLFIIVGGMDREIANVIASSVIRAGFTAEK